MEDRRVQNIEEIPSQYVCSICELLLRDPVQLICGHRQCKLCIKELDQAYIQCFKCKEKTPKEEIFDDRGIANDMKRLLVTCCHCSWNGLFKNYQTHLMRHHSNGMILSPLVMQVQRLHEIFNVYKENVGVLKKAIQQFLDDIYASNYKIGIEEQSLPEDIHQENEICFVAYHGTLFVRIDNAQKRLNDPAFTITSPPFYTSPCGYKTCIRLYLHGDSADQPTHLSTSIIIIRGEYDDTLKWPCNLQFIFCLYNLINDKEHLIESFQLDTSSTSFQRPQSEMNITSSLSKFVPLSIIQNTNNPYLFDNRLYLKLMIRENPIPIDILPNIININPGFPKDIQEKLIQQQIEKQRSQSHKLILTLKLQRQS